MEGCLVESATAIQESGMIKTAYKAAVIMVLNVTAALSGQDTSVLSHVYRIYSLRHLNPSYIDSGIFLINNCLKTDPNNIEARILLSEIYLKKGNREPDDKKRLEWFTKGYEQANAALARDSLNGRAMVWEVSNFSMICKTKGIMSSLDNIPRIRKGIARALQLAPDFPKAYSAQGIIFMELPWFLGGNLDSACRCFEKGMALDTNYAGICLNMGKAYILKKDYTRAREYLNKVIAMKNPTDRAEYELANKPEAKALLEKIKDK